MLSYLKLPTARLSAACASCTWEAHGALTLLVQVHAYLRRLRLLREGPTSQQQQQPPCCQDSLESDKVV